MNERRWLLIGPLWRWRSSRSAPTTNILRCFVSSLLRHFSMMLQSTSLMTQQGCRTSNQQWLDERITNQAFYWFKRKCDISLISCTYRPVDPSGDLSIVTDITSLVLLQLLRMFPKVTILATIKQPSVAALKFSSVWIVIKLGSQRRERRVSKGRKDKLFQSVQPFK